jgi:hypothetical protein
MTQNIWQTKLANKETLLAIWGFLLCWSDDSDEYQTPPEEGSQNISTTCPALREQKALAVGCKHKLS